VPTGDQIEVEGNERLASTLADAAEQITDMEQASQKAGQLLEQRASANAPVASGALARSVKAQVEGNEVTVGSDLTYAAVTEYGGGNNIPAQPYMGPALEASEGLVLQIYTEQAEAALATVKGA
jgi:HK97 gp10 family phage protein